MQKNEMISKGPIPGENFTSDTRNQPWHRPPEIVDLDEAVEVLAKKIMEPKAAHALLTFLEMGMTVATATSTLVTGGIGAGKWTPDMALLVAGPCARMIELMAKSAGIKYRMGIEENEEVMTPEYFTEMNTVDKDDLPSEEEMEDIKEQVKPKSKGFGLRPAQNKNSSTQRKAFAKGE